MTNVDAFIPLKTGGQCTCEMFRMYLLIKVKNTFGQVCIFGSASSWIPDTEEWILVQFLLDCFKCAVVKKEWGTTTGNRLNEGQE